MQAPWVAAPSHYYSHAAPHGGNSHYHASPVRQQADAAFDMTDTKREGVIDLQGFMQAVKRFGVDLQYNEMLGYFQAADTNTDGNIGREEFARVCLVHLASKRQCVLPPPSSSPQQLPMPHIQGHPPTALPQQLAPQQLPQRPQHLHHAPLQHPPHTPQHPPQNAPPPAHQLQHASPHLAHPQQSPPPRLQTAHMQAPTHQPVHGHPNMAHQPAQSPVHRPTPHAYGNPNVEQPFNSYPPSAGPPPGPPVTGVPQARPHVAAVVPGHNYEYLNGGSATAAPAGYPNTSNTSNGLPVAVSAPNSGSEAAVVLLPHDTEGKKRHIIRRYQKMRVDLCTRCKFQVPLTVLKQNPEGRGESIECYDSVEHLLKYSSIVHEQRIDTIEELVSYLTGENDHYTGYSVYVKKSDPVRLVETYPTYDGMIHDLYESLNQTTRRWNERNAATAHARTTPCSSPVQG